MMPWAIVKCRLSKGQVLASKEANNFLDCSAERTSSSGRQGPFQLRAHSSIIISSHQCSALNESGPIQASRVDQNARKAVGAHTLQSAGICEPEPSSTRSPGTSTAPLMVCQRPSRHTVACGVRDAFSAFTASCAFVVSYLLTSEQEFLDISQLVLGLNRTGRGHQVHGMHGTLRAAVLNGLYPQP